MLFPASKVLSFHPKNESFENSFNFLFHPFSFFGLIAVFFFFPSLMMTLLMSGFLARAIKEKKKKLIS
jgi:hypothetical protein